MGKIRIRYILFMALVAFVFFVADLKAQDQPPYENLYMIGDAAPAGWNIISPTELQQDPNDPWVFTYEGYLLNGDFKLLTFTGGWCDEEDWIRPPAMHPSLGDTDYIITTGCPEDNADDYTWQIEDDEISNYTITVDLRDETITIVNEGAIDIPYDNLYLAGNATAGGWDNPTVMEQDSVLQWMFTFEGFLTLGEFYIKTFEGESCDDDWIRPPSMHADLSETEYIITTGCPAEEDDYRWEITTANAGEYSITVDFNKETVSIIVAADLEDPVIEHVFLIGDATPGEWSLDDQTPMDRDEQNSMIFTWTGELTAGELKFKAYEENDFCYGDWIHPLTNGQDFSETSFEMLEGCGDHDDNKWIIGDDQAGTFSITINLDDETITFSGDAVSAEHMADQPLAFGLNQNYPNPFNPVTTISYHLPERAEVRLEVFDLNGRSIALLVDGHVSQGRHEVKFDAGNLASGLYIYRLHAGDFMQTKKLMLIK